VKSWKVVAAVLAAVAGFAAIVLGILFAWDHLEERARRTVEERATKILGGPVSVDRLQISFFPSTVHLEGVRFEKRGNRGSEARGTMETIVVRVGLWTLLGKRPGPVAVDLKGPRVQVMLAEGREFATGGDEQALLGAVPAGSSLEAKDAEIELGFIDGPRARLTGVSLRGGPGPEGIGLRGHFEFTGGDYHGPGGDWPGLRGDGTFKTGSEGVTLDPISIHAEGFSISGRGVLGAGARADVEGEIAVGAELERWTSLLPANAFPTGHVEARLSGSWRSGVAQAQGDFEATHLKMWGIEAGSLLGEIKIGEGVHLSGIRAHVFGGEATGSVDVARKDGRVTATAELRVDGVDAAQVLAYAGWGGPALRGTIHYRGQHQIDSGGIQSLRGSGVIDAVGHFPPRGGTELPLEVTSNLTTEGETIHLEGGTIRAGSTRGDFSGTVAPGQGVRLRLTGATGNIAEILPLFAPPPPPAQKKDHPPSPQDTAKEPTQRSAWRWPAGAPPALAVILPAFLTRRVTALPTRPPVTASALPATSLAATTTPSPAGESALERILRALGGRWEWDGELEVGRGGLSFEGTLSGHGLALKGIDVGSLRARIIYRDESLGIRDACVRLEDGGAVCLDGRVEFRGEGAVAIDAVATNYPFAPILETVGVRLPIEGRLDGTIVLAGKPHAPSGRAHVQARAVTVAGLAFDALTGDLLFTPDLLEAQGITLALGQGTLTLQGPIAYKSDAEWLPAEKGELRRLSIVGSRIDLSSCSDWLGGLPIEGRVDLNGLIGGSLEAPEGSLVVEGAGLRMGGAPLGELRLEAELAGDAATVQADLPAKGAKVHGKVALREGMPVDLTFTLSGTELTWEPPPPGVPEGARVALTGQANLEGPLLDWRRLAARARMERLVVEAAGVQLAAEGPVEMSLESARLRLAPAVLAGAGTRVEGHGEVDLSPGRAIDLVATGTFDLTVLKLFVPNLQATGRGVIRVSATGTASRPSLQGHVEVSAGAIRHPGLPCPIAGLAGRALFENSTLRIESLRFLAGGGQVEGSGDVAFGGDASTRRLSIRKAELFFTGTDVKADFPEGFRSVSDIDVALRRDHGATRLSGRIYLVRGVYSRDFRLESGLGAASADLFEIEAPAGPLAGLELDLEVRAASDLWLRNDLGSLQGRGELKIQGTVGRPTVRGRITATEGGTIRFRNVRYRVQRGTIDFSEPEGIDPIFDLQAETQVSDYQVTLRVEGKVDDFRYELASTPPLPQPDIVALLVTGRTLGSLGPEGRAVAGELAEETVSSYLTGRLTGELAERISGRGGFDVVVIDPLQVNAHGDPTTRVTVGKQVTPDLFVTYSDELGSNQGAIYQLDYALARDVHFTGLRDRDGSIGGDFRLLLRHTPPQLRGVADPDADRPILGSIRLEGDLRFRERKIRRLLRLKPGRARDRAAVNDGVDRVLRFYRDHGFLMAEVDPEETRDEGGVDLVVRVNPGPRVKIEVESARDREWIRERVETLWEGGLFVEDLVDRARQRIESDFRDRGYASASVKGELLASDEHSCRVRFTVDRGPRARADAVSVAGSHQVPEKAILRVIRTSPDTFFSRGIVRGSWLAADRAAIGDLYRSRGFALVSVPPPEVTLDATRRKATVTFRVEEGPRITLRDVRFEGNRALPSERLLALAALPKDSVFNDAAVEAAATRLRKAYDAAGYPDVRVGHTLAPGVREESDRHDDLVFSIEEGTRQTVETIEITGNLITRDRVLRKALTIKPGDPLSRADLLASQTRLYGRELFRSVSVEPAPGEAAPSVGDDPWPRVVRVEVQEAPPLSQVLGIGYDSEEKVRGLYEFTNRNVFGNGRSVGLQTRASSLEQRTVLSYSEKGIFGGRFDALASAFYEDEERPAFDVRTIGSSVLIGRRHTRATRTQYRYSLKDVDLSDAAADFEGTTLRLSNLAVSAIHDTRDAPFDPRRGHYLSGEVQYFGRSIGSEAEFTKVYGQVFLFKQILPKTVWAQALRAGAAIPFGRSEADPTLTGDDVSGLPPSERFFAGGDTTVRGFERDRLGSARGAPEQATLDVNGDPIGGEGLFLINEELRFPIYRRLHGVLFYDGGNVYRTLETYRLDDLRHVAGAGLRLATPIGPVRLEYGAILDREEGEPRGELFLSIGQPF
jgi:outer membrane protein insertion porin family